MYNFRYHLITIVSIFAALAIGLLLGVAIAGSELVKDTSDDMTASLMGRFDDLSAENDQLSESLTHEQNLRKQLFLGWQTARLEGRIVAILSLDSDEDNALSRTLANLVSSSGGIPVLITIDKTLGFGTRDETITNRLHEILPLVEGEDYALSVARALTDEWTFSYQSGAATVEEAFAAQYPLTTRLIDTGCVQVKVDYRSVINSLFEMPAAASTVALAQREAYQLAQEQQLPYACNGLLDTVTLVESEDVPSESGTISLSIATFFNQRGASGSLPYLRLPLGQGSAPSTGADQPPADQPPADQSPADQAAAERPSDAPPTTDQPTTDQPTAEQPSVEQTPIDHSLTNNYYVVLVQDGSRADDLVDAAYQHDLSCVISPFDPTGSYSIIALLSGAENGVYGLGRDDIAAQPPYPSDQRGLAPFIP
ncbi:MAG: copper transporter [Coriobacteriales bacterium]|jgi:hypothetical protein|nr:copper transporter [Coriobacteriales bacterium]